MAKLVSVDHVRALLEEEHECCGCTQHRYLLELEEAVPDCGKQLRDALQAIADGEENPRAFAQNALSEAYPTYTRPSNLEVKYE